MDQIINVNPPAIAGAIQFFCMQGTASDGLRPTGIQRAQYIFMRTHELRPDFFPATVGF
ncbi:MAG: hypothetical protein HY319_09915 [Armatimonadetes bacterium]|nr:hypothetical protein [Armatimonadota bacterium]